MRIILIGRGKMGTLIRETAAAAGDEIEAVFGRDDLGQLGRLGRVADVVMDFSRPEALPEVASYVRRTGTPLLSGTTGYTEAEKGSLLPWALRPRCCGAPTTPWGGGAGPGPAGHRPGAGAGF
ncbi:MAG: hypothetical protein ACLTYN_07050 [Dysosmobacter welbionis]